MRWYDIAFGVLLILSIIDFALAAPVLVQEKSRAQVHVAHMAKDAKALYGKRGSEQLDKFKKLAEDYFEKWGKPVWWPEEHASTTTSSSSVPSGHKTSDDFKKVAEDYFEKWGKPVWWPEEHASTASSSSVPSGHKRLDEFKKLAEDYFAKGGKPVWWPNEHGSSSSAPPVPDHGPINDVKAPAPNPALSPAHPDPLNPSPIANSMPVAQGDAQSESDYEWLYDGNGKPLIPIASESLTSTSSGSVHELTGPDVPQPNPNKRPSAGPGPDFVEGVQQQNPGSGTNSKSNWYQLSPLNKRPKLAASSEEFSQAHEDQVQQPNPGQSADPGDPSLLRPALPEKLNQGLLRLADGHPILMPPPSYLPKLSPTEVNSHSYPSPEGLNLGPLWLADGHPMMTAPLPQPHPLSSTEVHSYSYPSPEGFNLGPLWLADGRPILTPAPPSLPELSPTEVNSHSYPSPEGLNLGPLWLPDGHPMMTASLPPPHPLSSTEVHSDPYLGPVVHPPSPGARSTVPENEVVSSPSLNLKRDG